MAACAGVQVALECGLELVNGLLVVRLPAPQLGRFYPGQRPGRVLRFLPPEVEKAWSEAWSAHSVGAYIAAEMMCLPGHKWF